MDKISEIIADELGVKKSQVDSTIKLIDDGNTIPFIARYRKEATGGLSDEQLRNLGERLTYFRNLEERKQEVIKSIDSQGKLTDEIVKSLKQSKTLADVEDIYRPYKQKKRTRATIAKEKGLDELAKIILRQDSSVDIDEVAKSFINEEKGVNAEEDARSGALDIIAEAILAINTGLRINIIKGVVATTIFYILSVLLFGIIFYFNYCSKLSGISD